MGRKRLHVDPDEPLPKGLYKDGLQFRARHPGQKWVWFGRDYSGAIVAFKAWQRAKSDASTVAGLLDVFVGRACQEKVAAGKLKPRTARDYGRDADILRAGLGKIPLAALDTAHIQKFADARAIDAPSHVRNELACLSAALTWAVQQRMVARNVCRDIDKPEKRARERLVADGEYLKVYERAGASVRLAMALCVRTLAAPGDALKMSARNVMRYPDGKVTLRFRRGKTNAPVEIEVVGELAAALEPFLAHPSLRTFIRKRDGTAYTVDGIGAMFRRHAVDAEISDFGLRDLRAKGATDMFRAGVPIRQIQLLLGHSSVRTTEIYLKGLLAEIVRPNEQPIIASVK